MVAEEVSRYIERDGCLWDQELCVTENLTDELLAYGYLRFQEEKLLPYLFYEGNPGLKWFLDHFGSHKMDVLGCFQKQAKGTVDLAGFTWLNCKSQVGTVFTKAEVGQGYFRSHHNTRDTVRWAKLSADYAFRFLGVDVLFGTTPVKNRAAILAARRAGFKVIAEIPDYTCWEGERCSVALTHLSKEEWNGRK
jgi:hypothetical protein